MDREFSNLTVDEKKMIVAALQAVTQTGGSTREWRLANELARSIEPGYNTSDESAGMVMDYQRNVIREWQEADAEFPDLRRCTSFEYPNYFDCATAWTELQSESWTSPRTLVRIIVMEIDEDSRAKTINNIVEYRVGHTIDEEDFVAATLEPLETLWRRAA